MSAVDKFSVVVVDENGMCPVEREVLDGGRLLRLSKHSLGSEKGLYIYLWMHRCHKYEWKKLVDHFVSGEYEDGGTISVEYVGEFRYPVKVYQVTMEKVRKEEARVCEKCEYYGGIELVPGWLNDNFGYICRRRQVKSVNPLSGFDKWDGNVLMCAKEREEDLSWWEQLIGKCCRGDKCGKEGKYWVRR